MEYNTLEELPSAQNVFDPETLNRLYEESVNHFREGEIIEGEIVDLAKGIAVIDIGYKSAGPVPLAELSDPQGKIDVHVGDKLDVLLIQREDENGQPVLSVKQADELKALKYIEDIYHENGIVKGKIVSEVKGGFIVDIGIQAFLPRSQVDFKHLTDKKSLIGSDHSFKIIEFNPKKRNIVLSRRKYKEEIVRKQIQDHFKIGEVYTGEITAIVDFGLFVDLGQIEGLVHRSNLSWGKQLHPSKQYQIGEQVQVKILDIDVTTLRISLGIKQLEPNPWETIAEKYPVGAVIEGEIKTIQDFGIFVGIASGIEGLVHISNILWTKTLAHPRDVFKEGQWVRALILDIDRENERISLGIKQLTTDPWEYIPSKYHPGSLARGKIARISESGLIIRLEESVEGIIPPNRMSEVENIEQFKSGDRVEVKVISVSEKAKKIELTLSRQHEQPDPMENIEDDEKFARALENAMMDM